MTIPKVWSKFTGKNSALKLCIMDAPQDRLDEAVNLYIEYFLAEESYCVAAGVSNNEEAKEEYRAFKTEESKNKSHLRLMICCIENEEETPTPGDIIGVSFSFLMPSEKPLEVRLKPKSKELKKLMELFGDLLTMYDVLSDQNVDKCLEGMGIIVHPDYRGLGIAQEFLRARRLLCKEQGIPITVGWMSTTGTQIAAQREGYETLHEFNFANFGKKHGVSFESSPPTCKVMGAKIY